MPPHPAGPDEGAAPDPGATTPGCPASQRRGLLLQDISSNNLLVHEVAEGTACELLFSDPSRAQLAAHLERPNA